MPQTKKPKGSVMSKVKAVVKAVKAVANGKPAAKPAAKVAKPAKVAAKVAAKPVAKAAKTPAKPVTKAPAKVATKAAIKVVAKVPAKAIPKMEEPQKVLENSKVALKKETITKEAAVAPAAEKPVKPPKAPKVPRISAAALARAEKATDAANQLSAKWSSLYKKAESIEAKPYNMKAVFEEKTAIVHKILGWGYIMANKNDRLEVLFKDGIKYLISNYKPA